MAQWQEQQKPTEQIWSLYLKLIDSNRSNGWYNHSRTPWQNKKITKWKNGITLPQGLGQVPRRQISKFHPAVHRPKSVNYRWSDLILYEVLHSVTLRPGLWFAMATLEQNGSPSLTLPSLMRNCRAGTEWVCERTRYFFDYSTTARRCSSVLSEQRKGNRVDSLRHLGRSSGMDV